MLEEKTEIVDCRCDRCKMIIKREKRRGRRILESESKSFQGPFRVTLGDKVLVIYDKLCPICAKHMKSLVKSGRHLGKVNRTKGGRKKC